MCVSLYRIAIILQDPSLPPSLSPVYIYIIGVSSLSCSWYRSSAVCIFMYLEGAGGVDLIWRASPFTREGVMQSLISTFAENQ